MFIIYKYVAEWDLNSDKWVRCIFFVDSSGYVVMYFIELTYKSIIQMFKDFFKYSIAMLFFFG